MTHLFLSSLLSLGQQALPSIPVIEPDVPTWLSAAVSTGGLFQIIKMLSKKLGYEISGGTAMVGSFITAIAVVLGQVQVGALTILPTDVGGVLPYAYGLLTEALKATVAANGLYLYVYKETLKQLGQP